MSSEEFISVIRVPSSSTNSGTNNGEFISVIDSSGSMRPFWPSLAKLFNEYTPKKSAHTITFSGSASICKTNTLTTDLNRHGGGLTNIPAAFTKLDTIVASISESTPITVLFVSDGQDNNLRTLPQRLKALKGHQNRKITFLCLGIQSAFPTFLSMTLRDLYHSTQSSIPALFLIEYYTEAALRNKFEAMKEFFSQKKKIKVSPPLKEFPWSFEESDELYEESWIVVTDEDVDSPIITINGKEINLCDYPPTIDVVLEVFRSYVQEMQMLSLNTDSEYLLAEQAGEALRVMRDMVDYFIETKNIDLLKEFKLVGTLDSKEIQSEVDQLMKLSFQKRVEFNTLRHNQFRIQGYFENIELLAKGLGVQQLNEWEAAKRIGIGTITGNYHQRALNLNGLTVDAFKIIRNEFIELYNTVQFSSKPSNQEESVITLENQKDVFLDPDFAAGLQSCSSQFDLVETFPVVGLALQVKRPPGMDVNPWLVDVRSIAKHNRQMDSFSLLKSDFRMELSTGAGETEIINAVLPLFSLNDGDMEPLLRHDLFNLLMTFVVQRNVDTLDSYAYLALLGNTMVYFLTSLNESEYRTDMLQSIFQTIQLVYGGNAKTVEMKDLLMNNPEKAFFQQKEDLAKIITFIVVLHFSKSLEEEHAQFLLSLLFIRFFEEENTDWKLLVQMDSQNVDEFIQKAADETKSKFNSFSTIGEVSRSFGEACKFHFRASSGVTDSPLSFKQSKFSNMGRITFTTLMKLSELVTGTKSSEEQLLHYLYLAKVSTKTRMENLPGNPSDSIKAMKDILLASPDVVYEAKELEMVQELRKEFTENFQSDHKNVIPLSPSKVLDYCNEFQIDPTTLQYDSATNLVRNACMAVSCPFFLRPMEDLSKHLATWQEKCPRAFHKVVKENHGKEPKELLSMVLDGTLQSYPKVKQNLNELSPSDPSVALDYIKLVSEAYQAISKESSDIGKLTNYTPQRRQRKRSKNRRPFKRNRNRRR